MASQDVRFLTFDKLCSQNHLLNPRACKKFLWSSDAASSPDPEVQAVLASLGLQQPSSNRVGGLHSLKPSHSVETTSPNCHQPGSDDGGSEHRRQHRRQHVLDAEATLRALQLQCRDLEHDNALMRAKEQVYTQGTRLGMHGRCMHGHYPSIPSVPASPHPPV